MPDLVIKPTAGSGNKLILQDQGGGALLTSAASGATLADDVQDNITRTGSLPILKLTPTATASAPAGTQGAMYYDSDLGSVMVHSGSVWNMISAGTATGGTETTYTGYKVHTFTGGGTFIN